MSLAAFATRHTNGATYQIVALVLPATIQREAATVASIVDTLSAHLQDYTSVVSNRSLSE